MSKKSIKNTLVTATNNKKPGGGENLNSSMSLAKTGAWQDGIHDSVRNGPTGGTVKKTPNLETAEAMTIVNNGSFTQFQNTIYQFVNTIIHDPKHREQVCKNLESCQD